jgi:hypothetical protein
MAFTAAWWNPLDACLEQTRLMRDAANQIAAGTAIAYQSLFCKTGIAFCVQTRTRLMSPCRSPMVRVIKTIFVYKKIKTFISLLLRFRCSIISIYFKRSLIKKRAPAIHNARPVRQKGTKGTFAF